MTTGTFLTSLKLRRSLASRGLRLLLRHLRLRYLASSPLKVKYMLMGAVNIPTGDPTVKAPIVADEAVTVHVMARSTLMVMASSTPSDVVVDTVVIDEEATVVAIAVVVVVTGRGVVDVTVHMEENV